MKKLGLVVFFLLLLCSRYSFVDMRQYETKQKTVEVKGEVYHPGTYEVAVHASVEEILQLAGGCKQDADISSINLAMDIANESVLVIPKQQEEVKISINSASLEELDSLPGIGPSIAQRIIDYRNQTPFQTIEDIKKVKGIKDALFHKIQDRICL